MPSHDWSQSLFGSSRVSRPSVPMTQSTTLILSLVQPFESFSFFLKRWGLNHECEVTGRAEIKEGEEAVYDHVHLLQVWERRQSCQQCHNWWRLLSCCRRKTHPRVAKGRRVHHWRHLLVQGTANGGSLHWLWGERCKVVPQISDDRGMHSRTIFTKSFGKLKNLSEFRN